MSWLLYGSTGWIGGMLNEMLTKRGETVHLVHNGAIFFFLFLVF